MDSPAFTRKKIVFSFEKLRPDDHGYAVIASTRHVTFLYSRDLRDLFLT